MKKSIIILICTVLPLLIFADEKVDLNKLPEDVLSVLEKADKIEILSIDPVFKKEKDVDKTKEKFHGYQVIGKIEVKEEVRKKIISSFLEDMVGKNEMAKCFEPRHAIHAVLGEKTVDLVICFRCQQFNVYVNSSTTSKTYAISKAPEPIFDKVLIDAGIPKAK